MKLNKKFFSIGISVVAFTVIILPAVSSAEVLTRQLQLGMSGADVTALQTFLAKDNTIYPQGIISGYFGSLTKSAVSNFQARNGISSVGRVGPVTLVAINAQMNNGMTAGLDRIAPSISSINVSPSNNSVNISWNTNENASAVVYYGTSPLSITEGSPSSGVTIGGSSVLVSTSLQSVHSTTISNLNSNTNYYYVLYVRDVGGNESVSLSSMFKTN